MAVVKTRKIPMRMCAGCRERKPKKELVRVVRTPQGETLIDLSGKRSGRGAYICADNAACLIKAVKSKALERALEVPVPEQVYKALEAQLAAQSRDGG